MTLRPDQIGDRGQRFEVRYVDHTSAPGQHKVVGWSGDLAGAEEMANAWRLRPTTKHAWVADRQWADPTQPGPSATHRGRAPGDPTCDEA